jgi:hypothetical protein
MDTFAELIKAAVWEALKEGGFFHHPAGGPRLMRVVDAAEYLDCTPAHVHNLIARRVLKPVRWPLADGSEGRTIWIDRADLDRAIEEHKGHAP